MDNYHKSRPSNSGIRSYAIGTPQTNYNANIHSFQNFDPRLNYTSMSLQSYRNYDLSLRPMDEVEQKTDDELFLETWLSKIGKIQINLDSTVEIEQSHRRSRTHQAKSHLKISAAKSSLRKSLCIIKKLEETKRYLKDNITTMSSTTWKLKTTEIKDLKDEISLLTNQFENPVALNALKRTLQQRNKKRLRQHKKKIKRRELRAAEILTRNKAHEDIDRWLENMKDAVERTKMEENMKKDADCVLAEVTKKKSDARKQLSLISALVKLRTVRENAVRSRGEKTSSEDRLAFNKISEKLTKMWEDTFRVYTKEEQGLRIMLEEKNTIEDHKAAKMSREEKIIQQWDYYLFGPKCIPSNAYWGLTLAEKDMDAFVAVRRSWDTFLTQHDDENGSKIPIGWVSPSANAADGWTRYLNC